MSNTRIGFAMTGSFCTFAKAFAALKELAQAGYEITPILSFAAAEADTRFFKREEVLRTLEEYTGRPPLTTLTAVEPIGPKKLLDAYILAPMTGASLGKMANGIFDTPALLGAKSHLRNGRPVLIAPSTNDGLGAAAENIGKLLAQRNVYFVPFGQDDPLGKPCSLVADFSLIPQALAAALAGGQMQPVLLGGLKKAGK